MISPVTQPDPRRIGVIMLRQIGDVLLTTPALAKLRKRYPKARITAVVNDFTAAMLANNPDVDEVWSYPRTGRGFNWLARVRQEIQLALKFRSARFDLTIDFTSGDRPAFYSLISGARQRIAYVPSYKRYDWKLRAYTLNVPRPDSFLHQVERHLNLLAPLGIKPVNPKLVLRLTENELAWARQQKNSTARQTVLVHFVANWLFKCWDDEKAAELIDRLQTDLGIIVWFTSGPAEKEIARAKLILNLCKKPPQAWLGDISLRQLAALIAVSDVFVGVDTAPMHMAAALGVPVVALFGPTDPQQWSPWCERKLILGADCRCLREGTQACDWSTTRECLRVISVSQVQQAIGFFLASSSRLP